MIGTTVLKFSAYNYNLRANFLSQLADGEIVSSASCVATVYTGTDLTPSAILSGSPAISGSVVTQVLQGGSIGTVYKIVVSASTSAANNLTQTFLLVVEFDSTTATDQLVTTLGGTPVAAFTSVVTGLSVAFTDTSTDVGGTISAWRWVFGDGAISSSQSPTHVYTNTGDFSVTLTITDSYSGRTSTVTHTVTIAAASAALVSPPGWAAQTYNSTATSATNHATASVELWLISDGTWYVQNLSGAILGSGNWYYPTTTDIGTSYTGQFTPTVGSPGTYFSVNNSAAAATTLSAGLFINLAESGTFTGTDTTTGTVQVDIVPTGAGPSSTGTFTFNVTITTEV